LQGVPGNPGTNGTDGTPGQMGLPGKQVCVQTGCLESCRKFAKTKNMSTDL